MLQHVGLKTILMTIGFNLLMKNYSCKALLTIFYLLYSFYLSFKIQTESHLDVYFNA